MSARQCLMSVPCAPSVLLPEQNNDASVLTVGERPEPLAALERRITRYTTAHSIQLWKRDARTIQAAKKRKGKIAFKMPAALKYYQVQILLHPRRHEIHQQPQGCTQIIVSPSSPISYRALPGVIDLASTSLGIVRVPCACSN